MTFILSQPQINFFRLTFYRKLTIFLIFFIFSHPLWLHQGCRKLESISVVTRLMAGPILHRVRVHHRANAKTHKRNNHAHTHTVI